MPAAPAARLTSSVSRISSILVVSDGNVRVHEAEHDHLDDEVASEHRREREAEQADQADGGRRHDDRRAAPSGDEELHRDRDERGDDGQLDRHRQGDERARNDVRRVRLQPDRA